MAAKTEKKETRINVMSLHKRVLILEKTVIELIEELKARPVEVPKAPAKEPGINKIETFNGDVTPEVKDGLAMDETHKFESMQNAIKILPPNFVKDGRHSRENIQAICGFNVSQEMLDTLYSKFEHTAEGVVPI